jgi:NCS1 family nucleobase:cation symporter-1
MVKKSQKDNENIKTGPYADIESLPIPLERRNWKVLNFVLLWMNMSATIPTFMLGSSMIIAGLDVKTSFTVLIIGTLIMGLLVVLNSQAGTKYGIPFHVQSRIPFGVKGAQIPCLIRAFVAAGWYGIGIWIGALALNSLITLNYPGWTNIPNQFFYCFVIFLIANFAAVVSLRPSSKALYWISGVSTFMLIIGGIIWCFLLFQNQNITQILASPPKVMGTTYFDIAIIMLFAMIFYWSTSGLNIADYSRFGRSQKEQGLGQLIGIIAGQIIFVGLGILVSAAGLGLIGSPIWNPIEITGNFSFLFASFILIVVIIAATKTNITANNIAANLIVINFNPKRINWPRATFIITVIGIAFQPWSLLGNWQDYILGWIINYSVFLSAVMGMLIADYLSRKREIVLPDLYKSDSKYWYSKGINWYAIAILFIGIAAGFSVRLISGMTYISYSGPIISMVVSSVLYFILFKAQWENKNAP